MLNVGTPELLVILLVALLVLGPTKLPEAARQVGRAVAELRRLSSGFQNELRNAMDQPTIERSPTPLATPAPTDHEAMNATLAAARDEAIEAAEVRARREPLKAAPAKKAAPATKASAAKKKSAPAKKAAAAKKRS